MIQVLAFQTNWVLDRTLNQIFQLYYFNCSFFFFVF
jgi:hypothetical protein